MKPIAAAMLVSLLASAPAAASPNGQRCYSGDASSGELIFSAAVEKTEFTGRFGEFSVSYCLSEPDAETHDIDVRVKLASADTDNRDRDETLVGPQFFDVDSHPVSRWRSREVRRDGDSYVAEGTLALKGVQAPQSIRYRLSPDGEAIIARGEFVIAGDAVVDRQRYGVGTGEFADPDFVRNEVRVEFEVRLTEATADSSGES